jgi:uncharacterized protein YaiI (UPF0178 family)
MKIWVDADACPAVIKDILFRAAQRTGVELTLVANRQIHIPKSQNINSLKVKNGFDVADMEIMKHIEAGDLIITADIPLAAEAMEKRACALNPRGEMYSVDTIRQRLNIRDFMETMRASGIHTGGPAVLSKSERKLFADNLDKFLTGSLKKDQTDQ